jgi:hypothetical protein
MALIAMTVLDPDVADTLAAPAISSLNPVS